MSSTATDNAASMVSIFFTSSWGTVVFQQGSFMEAAVLSAAGIVTKEIDMKSFRWSAVALVVAVATQGCGLDDLNFEPHFKKVDGKTITQALGSTVSEVIDSLDSVITQGPNIDMPDNVRPPADLFEDGVDVAAAPGLRPMYYENSLSAWQGPEAGPDGKAGWYFREASATTWNYDTSEEVVWKWRYWLRFEPAADVTKGLADISADRTHYGYTSENGTWHDWKYVVSFGVTRMTTDGAGKQVPAEVEGSWVWEVGPNAEWYRGSRSEGTYVYSILNPEHLFMGHEQEGYDDEEDEVVDPYGGMKVGESRSINLGSKGKSDYTGVFYDRDNELESKWYGGSTNTSSGTARVTRKDQDNLSAVMEWAYGSLSYWGQGERPAGVDFTKAPAFVSDSVPAGDAWGIPVWSHNQELEARDGLLYWSRGEGAQDMTMEWNATLIAELEAKVEAARAVMDDPESTQEERTKATEDMQEAYNAMDDAFGASEYVSRSKGSYMQWNGMQNDYDYVYCSEPSLDDECPAEQQW